MARSFSFEGPEGVGKTAQVRVVGEILDKILHLPVLIVREPGGTLPGEAVRNILKNEDFRDMHARTNVLLYNASRNELIFKMILPWLNKNPDGICLSDRCWWSTLALQTVDGEDVEYIKAIQKPFTEIWPDKVIYTDLTPYESTVRVERARLMKEEGRWWRDYVGIDIYSKIRQNYLQLVKEYRDKTLLLDGFVDPATRAYDTVAYILGEKPFEFTNEIRQEFTKIWEKATGISYSEMLEMEGRIRLKRGINKESHHHFMLEEWKRLGLETTNNSGAVERR